MHDSHSMTRRRVATAFRPAALLPVLLALGAPRLAAGQAPRLPPFIEVRIPKAPSVAFGSGGVSFLAYELHLTNFTPAALTLRRVDVVSAGESGGGRVIHTFADSALAATLARPGMNPPPAPADRTRIGPGLRAVAFLWVPVDAGTPPQRLRHRLTFAPDSGGSAEQVLDSVAVVPVTTDIAVIGPPLRGGPWLAGNGPNPMSGHRRSLIPVGGVPSIAQRFAIDYVKLNDSGRTFMGDRLRNESYGAEGVDALAVADGVVAATKDSIPENVPGMTSRAVPITLVTVGGNYVILDIGQGRYAFYAHLKPGSLRVRKGERVRRGQVLGLVGNSGNSTEPHLHFHLGDSPSPLGSEGIPYVHQTLELVGRCQQMLSGCTLSAPETRRREMPMGNIVVRFPE
ncbi:MAG: M23 family metallopeptidase [Gemmatimonadaceae bacterium]